MKSIYKLILLLLLVYPVLGSAQEYSVGTASFSIEPAQSLVSLHLGGYGGPKEGRFTLQWKVKESLPAVTTISGISDKLYMVSNSELLYKDLSENSNEWKKAGKAEKIITIAGLNNKLYAINNIGDLLLAKTPGKISWKRASSIDKSVTCLTASGDKLFAANETGDLWTADLSKGRYDWVKLSIMKGIISLGVQNGNLYALTNEGIIYKGVPVKMEIKWLKVAYKNNVTITEDIRQITFANGKIYGVARDNNLYEGKHRTDGNLYAKAMAVKNDENIVLIITLDVCGINGTYSGLIKKEIYQKFKIPASAVFINSSHTHFAPVSQNWFTWQEPNQIPDSTYLYSTVKKGIMNAVDKSLKSLAPAQLYFGRGKADIGYNRSLKDHPELYDNAVDVLKVKYSENAEAYLFLASCHAVFSSAGTLHYTTSANFPGVACKLLEERTGTSNAMFLQGTAGDINPIDNGAYITGEKLANEVMSILNKPMIELNGAISFFLDTINIPIKPWGREEILSYKAANIDKPDNVGADKNVKWCNLMLKYYDEGTMQYSMPVYINTLNIGKWKLVGFSRETTTEYGLGVKKMWPDKLISVAGYTNDVSSYLPTTLHIQARNYEGLDSFFWYGMPNTFPEEVEKTILSTIEKLSR